MKASSACFDLIRSHESLRLDAYPDPATGGDPWTIGYGSTGPGVREGVHITEPMAEALLLEDVYAVEAQLRPLLGSMELTQGQYDALVSLAFNVGARRLPMIAPKLWRYLRDGKRELAAAEFANINHANGKVMAGLTKRRIAEAQMFMA